MRHEDRSYVYEREVGDESLHFSDDLGFGASLEGLKGYVEHRLLLHYLLYNCFSMIKASNVLGYSPPVPLPQQQLLAPPTQRASQFLGC